LCRRAGIGHIKAAKALDKSFAADDWVAEAINHDAPQYTNKLFRDFLWDLSILKGINYHPVW